ncbi:hypothetical protein BH10PSE12_BH10PSE12_20800 [soil metagenome]|jgi:hypothetical protein
MKKAFWLLALGALASAVMAASLGRAADAPQEIRAKRSN